MKPSRAPSIRARLVLLVTACVVPAALLVVALIGYHYQQARAQVIGNAQSTAAALAAAVDRDLAGVQAVLQTLATSHHLRDDDLEEFYAEAKDALRGQKIVNFVLIDPAFRQRINTLRPFGSELPVERTPALRRALETGRPFTSDMFVGPVAGEPLIAVGVPIMHGAKLRYILGASILPSALSEILSQQRLPAGWIGVVFDSTGTIVARTHDPQRFVGQMGAPALVQRMREVGNDTLEITSVEGIRLLATFSKSSMSNFTVALGIPIATLIAPLETMLRWLVIATMVLLGGSILLATLLANRIASSVRRLVEPALALGRGEAVAFVPLGLQEADEVARALADASTMLVDAERRASHDVLTGLANRARFDDILKREVAMCQRSQVPLAVLYIDLDGFKRVNDEHGHAVGDEVLRSIASRIRASIRDTDLAARLGGDEFAVILFRADLAAATMLADNLIATLAAPCMVGALRIQLSASIGIAAYPDSAGNAETLSRLADQAMYRAKNEGKRRYAVM